MTATNIIKQRHAVHMLTDGASWIFNGGFGPACCKAWPIPHLRAVVSGSGARLGPMLFADFLNTAGRSYDEAKKNAVALVRDLYACHGGMLLGNPFGAKSMFVVAGWSETSGPDAFVISRGDDGAWISEDTGPVMMLPGDPAIQAAAAAAFPAGVTCAETMDAARDGLTIVMAQRAALLAVDGLADGMTAVGAFVQLTSVTQEGISTRILHSWPDEWGEPQVPLAETEAAA